MTAVTGRGVSQLRKAFLMDQQSLFSDLIKKNIHESYCLKVCHHTAAKNDSLNPHGLQALCCFGVIMVLNSSCRQQTPGAKLEI